MDIMLDLERLKETRDSLTTVLAEFADSASINNTLESAVSTPDDRTLLRTKVGSFESAWSRKRSALEDNLKNIQEQLNHIVDGWQEWDSQTAQDLSDACQPSE